LRDRIRSTARGGRHDKSQGSIRVDGSRDTDCHYDYADEQRQSRRALPVLRRSIARSTRIHLSFFHDHCHGMTPAAAIEHRSAGANRCAQFYAARRRAMKPSMPSPVNSSTRVAGSGTGPPAVTVRAAIPSSSAAIVGEIPSE
jgi:hypothetical protein